jgi:DNA (cytosine-5)-methyltransferase 1
MIGAVRDDEVKPTVVSLFTGVGGLDLGFEAAGFETVAAVEMDRVCCETLRLNRKWPVLEGDIHQITSREILAASRRRSGEVDVLIGGPPCQPFSKSGYWANGDSGRLADPRSATLVEYLRVLRDIQPRAFLLENVRGLAYQGKDEGLRFLMEGVEQINKKTKASYSIRCATLNAADYGVPQIRERVFLVGSRDGTPFEFPRPTHSPSNEASLLDPGFEPHRTAWDAIGDLPEPSADPALVVAGQWGDLLPTIPEGENYLWHTSRGGGSPLFGWRRRYWTFLLKLAKNRPSWTIQAQPGTATGPFHWKNRRLSAQELCRLQTFPDGLEFGCGRGDIQKMLGNAVPSLVAEILAREIRAQLLKAGRRSTRPKLLTPRRGPAPRPERLRPLPRKYFPMVGDHSAHPGTGKGWSRSRASSTDAPDLAF